MKQVIIDDIARRLTLFAGIKTAIEIMICIMIIGISATIAFFLMVFFYQPDP